MNYIYQTGLQSVCLTTKSLARFIAILFILIGSAFNGHAQIPITYYDFELNTARGTTQELTPELTINSAGSFTQVGYNTAATPSGAGALYLGSNGTGLGGSNFSAVTVDPTTAAATYMATTINTTNFTGITISCDYRSSLTTGPGNIGIVVTSGANTYTQSFATVTDNAYHTLSWTPTAFANNNASVTVKIYFYKGGNAGFTSAGTARIDNFTVRATSQTAGTANLIDEAALYAGFTSGGIGFFSEGGFTVTGASAICRMNNSGIDIGTGNTFLVTGSSTFDCGQTSSSVMSGLGNFQIDAGAFMIIRSPNGVNSTSTSGNIQTTGRSYAAGGNYTFQHFNGTAMSTGGGLPGTISGSIIFNNSGGIGLGQNQKITGTLTMTNTIVSLGTRNLTLGATAIFNGTFGPANMVVTGGAGEFRKEYAAAGSFLFPVGDITVPIEYSPATVNFTAGTFTGTAYASVRVINAKHPNNLSSTNYLNRYWALTTSNISAFTCALTFAYNDADIVGAESSMASARYLTSWSKAGSVNASLNTLTRTTSISLADYTAINGILPTATISGNTSPVCEGNSLTLTANPVGDAPFTYSWSTLETTPSISSNPSATTPYTVSVTDGNGFTSASPASTTVTVNPAATADANIDQTICSNATATMAGIIGGGASSGTWSTIAGADGTFDNASLLNAIYTPGTNDKIVGYATLLLTTNDPAGPCGSVNDAMVVFFDYPPVIGSCPSPITQCDNHVATFSTPTATGTPTPSVSCSPASGSSFATGTTSVTCTATNYCSSSSCSFSVTINTTPVIGACPGPITQCDNHVVNFSTPTSTATPAATVTCSPASGSTFATGTTNVTCTATNSCGSDACSFNVTINTTPVISACPAAILQCDNHVATWTDPTASGTPTATVVCSPSSGSTFVTGTTPVTCTATNSCGSDQCTFNVTISISAIANANADQTICYTGTATMNGSFGGGASSATWSTLGDGTFDNANLLNAVYTPGPTDITSHTATLVLSTDDPAGACEADDDQMVLTVLTSTPVQPGPVTGTTAAACPGNTLTYSISPLAGAISYTWASLDGNASVTGGQGSVSANILFGTLPGSQSSYPMSVIATNACGNSIARTFSPRNKISQPTFTIGLPVVVCQNTNSVVYSVNPVAGAASYTWTITGSGASIFGSNTGSSVTVNFGTFTSVTISVTATNACMTTTARVLTVNSVPSIPSTIIGASYVCPNGTYQYSVNSVPGATTYVWTGPAGSSVSGSSNIVNITFGTSIPSGSLVSVRAVGSCANNGAIRNKGVANGTPNTPSAISGLSSGQCGETGVSYSIIPNNAPPVTSYNWSVNNGASITGPGNLSAVSINFPGSFTTVVISVSANNGCGTGMVRTLSVTGTPALPPVISGNAVPCANSTNNYSTLGSIGASSYNWTVPSGATILGPANGPSILLQWGSSSGNVSVQAVNTCGVSAFRALPCVISCRQSQVYISANGFDTEVFPNPATEKATVKFTAASSSQYHLTMTNVMGQSVKRIEIDATKGTNMIDIDLNTLAKGVYMLSIMSGDNKEQIRVVVK